MINLTYWCKSVERSSTARGYSKFSFCDFFNNCISSATYRFSKKINLVSGLRIEYIEPAFDGIDA
jgi:hypothetical protein